MINMNDSEDKLDELMAGYVLGDLSPEEAEDLQQLLERQPEKIQDLDSLKATLGMMPYALPPMNPSPKVWTAIAESIEGDRQFKPIQKPFSRIGYPVMGSIAALLLMLLGWNNYQLRQNLITAQTEVAYQKDVVAMLQNPETHLVSLKGMDMAARASGRVIMTPGEPKSVLILQNLPTLPQGKYYQLWSIVNGKKVASGQFNADKNGTVLLKLPTPSALEVSGLLITLEESSAQNDHPLMVMTSSL
jgi:anti-sigma-K factor RskA